MNSADIVILALVVLSVGISLWRGFVREALSLLAYVAATWIAIEFTEALAGRWEDWFTTPTAALAAAFTLLFLATLLVGALLNFLIGRMLKKAGLTWTDRMLGGAFGLLRGVVVVVAFAVVAGFTSLPKSDWYADSLFLDPASDAADVARDWLGPEVAKLGR